MTTIRVYRMDDMEWWAGESLAACVAEGRRQCGDECYPDDPDEQRFLTLSNGELICDLNGNVYQWIFDDVQGDEQGIIARDFAKDSPSITTAPYPSGSHGMGDE